MAIKKLKRKRPRINLALIKLREEVFEAVQEGLNVGLLVPFSYNRIGKISSPTTEEEIAEFKKKERRKERGKTKFQALLARLKHKHAKAS